MISINHINFKSRTFRTRMEFRTKCLLSAIVLTIAIPVFAGYRIQNGRIYDDNNNSMQIP
jgi:hypothetical protein